jgi:DMSO/TMAO reductase YedYZ molybdopterin-dependent catalytic subunit
VSTEVRTPEGPKLKPTVGALIGVLAVVAALAVGQLIAAFVDVNSSPFLAVGNTVVRLTRGPLKEFVVNTTGLGSLDKPLLLVTMGVVMFVLAVVAGLLSLRRKGIGLAIIGVFGAVGVVAVMSSDNVGTLGVLSPLASLGVGLFVFAKLHDLAARVPAAPRDTAMPRRTFLRASTGVVVGSAVVGGGGLLFSRSKDITGDRAGIGVLTPSSVAPPIPADAAFVSDGTPTFLTPVEKFYRVDTALIVPQVRLADWRLRIHGMVGKPRTYTFDEIRAMDLVERTITMTCVSDEVGGPYISTQNFVGVPLRQLIAAAEPKRGVDQVFSTSVDGYTAGSPLETVLDAHRGAMLAIGMDRRPLPAEHGFPARLVVPGLYGYVSATKWVTDIELTTFAAKQGYWVPRGYSARAPIKTESRIDAPTSFGTVPAGTVMTSGIAFAQPRGIEDVQVRVNAGPWRSAQLAAAVNGSTWRMWRCPFQLKSGSYTVEARAVDGAGAVQTGDRAGAIPDGATGWPSVTFTVR